MRIKPSSHILSIASVDKSLEIYNSLSQAVVWLWAWHTITSEIPVASQSGVLLMRICMTGCGGILKDQQATACQRQGTLCLCCSALSVALQITCQRYLPT